MAQPKIPGTDVGIPRMPYGSDGDDWIALLVSGLGALQVELASLPTGAATIADGSDIALGALADALVAAGAVGSVSGKLRRLTTDLDALLTELKLKADLTETQPVSVEGFNLVPTTPILVVGADVPVIDITQTEILSYTVTEHKTFYLTDIYISDITGGTPPEFLYLIEKEGAKIMSADIPASEGLRDHLTTPIVFTSLQEISIDIYQWSGATKYYKATLVGFQMD